MRGDRATGDDDVFTGPGDAAVRLRGVEGDAVIARDNVAVGDADVRRPVDVDAVVVGHLEVVENPDAVDQHIVAPEKADGPEGGFAHRDVAHRHVAAVAKDDREGACLRAPVNVRCILEDVGAAIAVDHAGARDGDILGVIGEDHYADGDVRRGRIELHRVGDGGRVVLMVRAALQHGAALEIELHVAAQADGSHRDRRPGGHDDTTTAGGGAGVDGPLRRVGVALHVGAGDAEPAKVEGRSSRVGTGGWLCVHRQNKRPKHDGDCTRQTPGQPPEMEDRAGLAAGGYFPHEGLMDRRIRGGRRIDWERRFSARAFQTLLSAPAWKAGSPRRPAP